MHKQFFFNICYVVENVFFINMMLVVFVQLKKKPVRYFSSSGISFQLINFQVQMMYLHVNAYLPLHSLKDPLYFKSLRECM